MSILLIFRANQAYARYWEGRSIITKLFSDLRELLLSSMVFIHGGIASSTAMFHSIGNAPMQQLEDGYDAKSRELRVDVVRLTVALAVAFKLHTRICLDGYCFGWVDKEVRWRIDWDRLRLRQLLLEEEFRLVDAAIGFDDQPSDATSKKILRILVDQFRGSMGSTGPSEPPEDWPDGFEVRSILGSRPYSVIIYLIRELLITCQHDPFCVPWGLKERFVVTLAELLGRVEHLITMVDVIITTPVPLPYASLCKTLLTIYTASLPFFVDYKLGWFANTVIPAAVSLSLLGVDAIATELENPFGDDANDLDILELVATLESEAIEMLTLAGDHEARRRFCWRRVPVFIRENSYRPLLHQLAFVDVAAPEIVFLEFEAGFVGSHDEDSEEGGGSAVQSMASTFNSEI